MSAAPPRILLRELDPASADELEWVARGMHLTIREVVGERYADETCPMSFTRARLREFLDPARHEAQVFLALVDAGAGGAAIAGHTIVRIDADDAGRRHGLFSTTWVDPPRRRLGLADRLLARGEAWIRGRGLPEAATWTSEANAKLIRLYGKHGYAITDAALNAGSRMVRLTKPLA